MLFMDKGATYKKLFRSIRKCRFSFLASQKDSLCSSRAVLQLDIFNIVFKRYKLALIVQRCTILYSSDHLHSTLTTVAMVRF